MKKTWSGGAGLPAQVRRNVGLREGGDMKTLLLLIAMVVFSGSCTHLRNDQDVGMNDRVAQITPVLEYYYAIEMSDLDRFKAACSEETTLPPDRLIKEYFEVFGQYYGDEIFPFDPEDFNYSYEGGRSRGRVKMSITGDGFMLFPVVKEGGGWKLTSYSDKNAKTNRPIPQAKPLIKYIQAVKNDDLDRLKATYINGYVFPFSDEESLRGMKHLRLDLTDQYGFFYDPEYFDYSYEGGGSKGCVIWTLPGDSESFRVMKEDNEWKLY